MKNLIVIVALALVSSCVPEDAVNTLKKTKEVGNKISVYENKREKVFDVAPFTDSLEIEEVNKYWFKETLYALKNAKIILADYEALKRDFPFLAERDMSDAEIDEWILDYAAYISEYQIFEKDEDARIDKSRLREVGEGPDFTNTKIDYDPNKKTMGFRPPQYGRATLLPVSTGGDDNEEQVGFFDVKGIGAIFPSARYERNGMMDMVDCFKEYVLTQIIDKILKHHGGPYKVNPVYACIDGGGYKVNFGDFMYGGLLVRKAIKRYPSGGRSTLFDLMPTILIERIFRSYGLTSVVQSDQQHLQLVGKKVPIRYFDIQGGADQKTLMDFTTYKFEEKFEDYLLPHFYKTEALNIVYSPEHQAYATYVQPNEELRFKEDTDERLYFDLVKPFVEDIEKGTFDRKKAWEAIQDFIRDASSHLD